MGDIYDCNAERGVGEGRSDNHLPDSCGLKGQFWKKKQEQKAWYMRWKKNA